MTVLDVTDPDDPRLARFHAGIYLDAFAAQREPLEAWIDALRGDAPYRMHVRLAIAGDEILGGITYELYPQSECGLVTYMVVAPAARGQGLGRALFEGAARELYAAGARAVFGEVNDPRVHGDAARPRLERFLRWGARIVDVPYVQPSLGPGLPRDHGLTLIVLPPAPPVGEDRVRAFVEELYRATEGGKPDA